MVGHLAGVEDDPAPAGLVERVRRAGEGVVVDAERHRVEANVTYLPTTWMRVPAVSRDAAIEPLKPGLTEEPSARRSVKPPPSQPLEDAAEAVVGARRAATSAPPARSGFQWGHAVGTPAAARNVTLSLS